FPLTARKDRVLDAVALAGGASSAPGSATFTLIRGKRPAARTSPLTVIPLEGLSNTVTTACGLTAEPFKPVTMRVCSASVEESTT
ncbi:hypothetical protein ACC690_38325, partial [Rhizobium johnstonii]